MVATQETTGLDIATAIVAGYAALVATGALFFQVTSWLRTWQTRVEVTLRPNMRIASPGEPESPPVVTIDLVNHSGHRAKIVGQGFLRQRRGGPGLFIPRPRGLLMSGVFEIPPRDSVNVWLEYGDLKKTRPRSPSAVLGEDLRQPHVQLEARAPRSA